MADAAKIAWAVRSEARGPIRSTAQPTRGEKAYMPAMCPDRVRPTNVNTWADGGWPAT